MSLKLFMILHFIYNKFHVHIFEQIIRQILFNTSIFSPDVLNMYYQVHVELKIHILAIFSGRKKIKKQRDGS